MDQNKSANLMHQPPHVPHDDNFADEKATAGITASKKTAAFYSQSMLVCRQIARGARGQESCRQLQCKPHITHELDPPWQSQPRNNPTV
jgi:hypothetical protein